MTNETIEPTIDPLACLFKDCASGTNQLVGAAPFSTKTEVPLSGIQREFYEQFSFAEHLSNFETDGYPAWQALRTIDVSSEYRHYLIPVYQVSSIRVEAVISVIHYLGIGKARIDYLDRDEIDSYPSYFGSNLGNKNFDDIGTYKYTLEGVSYILLLFDDALFGAYGADVLDNLSDEARSAILAKDCKIKVNYVQETVWYTYNGGTLVDIDITYTFSTETTISEGVGCGGGNTPPSGPGSPGNGGPGGSTGSTTNGTNGPGVIVISTDPNDPNNRCIEDGVGCEDEEEEEDEEDEDVIIDPSVLDHPCAEEVTTNFFSGPLNEIAEMINFLFDRNDNVNLTIEAGPLPTGVAGNHTADGTNPPPSSGIAPTFNSTIRLNEDYLNCSRDFIYATLLHEAIHSYYEGLRVYLGNDTFNELYPLFGPQSNSEDDQHEFMAANYVNSIATLLMFENPNLRRRTAENLAWEGLHNTEAFDELVGESRLNEIGLTTRAARCDQDPNDLTNYRFDRAQTKLSLLFPFWGLGGRKSDKLVCACLTIVIKECY